MAQADAQQFAQETTGQNSSVVPMMFWGPTYFPSNRSVVYNGSTFTPTGTRAMSRPFMVTSRSSSMARSSLSSPGASARGGFGSSGARASSGSFGG